MNKAQRYEIQWDDETRLLVERASIAGGYPTVKAYLTHLIREDAPKVLNAYQQIKLSNEQFDNFLAACKKPIKPSSKLVKAAREIAKKGIWIETKD